MSDGSEPVDQWARYLKQMTDRTGWSVARLARESGIHRSTIFRWMQEGGSSVTIQNVLAIARALDDDPVTALHAAASVNGGTDPLLEMIDKSDLPIERKKDLIKQILVRRARYEDNLREDLELIIRAAER